MPRLTLSSLSLSPCSFAPLPTTNSKTTTTTTTAEFSQLAKESSLTSAPPSTNGGIFQQPQTSLQSGDNHTSAPSSPLTPSSAVTAPVYPEQDDEEEEQLTSICSPPSLVPITTGVTSPFKSFPSSSSSPSPTLPVSSDVFDKNPLWAPSTSAHSGPANTVCFGLGGVTSVSGIPPSTSPVYTSIPLSRSLGVRNVMFQSTPATSAVMGSNKNISVHVPMMYQLNSHPGVSHPLVAPILTMVPPSAPVPSVSGLINMPSSMLMTTPTTSSIVQSLIGSKLGVSNKYLDQENVPDSTCAEIGMMKEKATDIYRKSKAEPATEPATGQNNPFSEEMQFGSTYCPPSSSSSISGSVVPRILASIPHAELTPEQVELKSFAEDFKTRRIKLGFTQGSVGQSLAEKGYSNFAQSTISRFEQMQLSPTNATTIRVVLEQWLLEAESPEIANLSSSCGGNIPVMASRKRKKRAVFAPQTKSTLDTFFCQNPRPNRQAIEEISQQLDLLPEEVRVWFCNKRQKSKPGPISPIRSLSFGRESSISSTPSPSSSFDRDLGMLPPQQKHRSVSPTKMPFTIEELSKSSNTSTSTTASSPVQLMSPSVTHVDARSKFVPMLFSHNLPMLSNPLMSPFVMANHMAQTRA